MSNEQQIKHEALLVKELGEKIGYGNLMEFASALWRKDLKEKYDINTGAFVPTIMQWITDEGQTAAKLSCEMYDVFVSDL